MIYFLKDPALESFVHMEKMCMQKFSFKWTEMGAEWGFSIGINYLESSIEYIFLFYPTHIFIFGAKKVEKAALGTSKGHHHEVWQK